MMTFVSLISTYFLWKELKLINIFTEDALKNYDSSVKKSVDRRPLCVGGDPIDGPVSIRFYLDNLVLEISYSVFNLWHDLDSFNKFDITTSNDCSLKKLARVVADLLIVCISFSGFRHIYAELFWLGSSSSKSTFMFRKSPPWTGPIIQILCMMLWVP